MGNTSGCHNNFLGDYAGTCTSSGSSNNMLGGLAGRNNDTGSHNNFLGCKAGCKIFTGCHNTFIGELAGCNVTTGSCNIVIGPRVNTSGTTAASEVYIDSGTGNAACFSGSFSAWGNTSDCRDKSNVNDLGQGKDFLAQLRPVKFEWDFRDEDNKNGTTQGTGEAGFLAQEVQQLVAEHNAEYLRLVDENNPEKLGIYKSNFIPVLVKAVQELIEENKEIRSRLDNIGA